VSSADLAAAAAFTAAGLSLVNVAISARLASRGHREQWRRDQERPIVARCLTLSRDIHSQLWDCSVAKQNMRKGDAWAGSKAQQHALKGLDLLHDLTYETAQLDLLASDYVRQAARALVVAHQKEAGRLVGLKPGQDDDDARRTNQVKIEELNTALVERTRADFGLGSSQQVPPNSILGRTPGRDRE
jgi:hypothetical protein